MIARLSGKVVYISSNQIVLDVSGVGYEVYCSTRCLQNLSEGESTEIVIHTDVREDSIRLYGFEDHLEKQVFTMLTQVKGLGARSASDILSKIEKKELLRMIGEGNLTSLQSVKGIGKKTAERILVELKDKVAAFAIRQQGDDINYENGASHDDWQESAEALLALGFSRGDAVAAVQKVRESKSTGQLRAADIIKEALRYV